MISIVIFWVCLLLIGYTYCFYPAILFFLRALRQPQTPHKVPEKDFAPSVSVLVAAYNEGEVIADKIKNLTEIEYPEGKIEFLFGSDGSTDKTSEILLACGISNFHPVIFPKRRGKAAVLNDLISKAGGDVIVLSDANTLYTPQTIAKLVKHFNDSAVGAVCGKLILQSKNENSGGLEEISYWTYENMIKGLESEIQTTLGATGAVYAIRKNLFRPLPADKTIMDDFLISLSIIEQGFKIKYESEARAYEKVSGSVAGEFRRKVRIGAANFHGISEFVHLLHPRYGFASFALWSHKIVRWFAPFLLIALFVSDAFIAFHGGLYGAAFIVQLAFLILGFIGFIAETIDVRLWILGFPYYFIAMNAALLIGFGRFLFKRQRPTWDVVR